MVETTLSLQTDSFLPDSVMVDTHIAATLYAGGYFTVLAYGCNETPLDRSRSQI